MQVKAEGKQVFSVLWLLAGRLFDAVMFDVDNKDNTVGMSCPPASFVEVSLLQKVRSLLTPRGKIFCNRIIQSNFY